MQVARERVAYSQRCPETDVPLGWCWSITTLEDPAGPSDLLALRQE